MSNINDAIHDIHFMDEMSERDQWINRIHPLAKVLITFLYMVLVMSFDKYNLVGLAGMSIYIIVLMIQGELSFKRMLKRLRTLLIAICMIGIANPIIDRNVVLQVGCLPVTSGMISMLTLVIKACFAVFAAFILIESTSIENICYAMRKLHMPKIIVTMIMLIYRYIILMLKETERIMQAYALRAPNQKGIHYKAWGSLVGQMLLRSIDRAQMVYESMQLRGFNGEFYLKGHFGSRVGSVIYTVVWIIVLVTLRTVPVFTVVGGLF